jgi:hypothetical protein
MATSCPRELYASPKRNSPSIAAANLPIGLDNRGSREVPAFFHLVVDEVLRPHLVRSGRLEYPAKDHTLLTRPSMGQWPGGSIPGLAEKHEKNRVKWLGKRVSERVQKSAY